MSIKFANILRQAFKTFDRANLANFTINFQQLKHLTEQLNYRDLQLNAQEVFNAESHDSAPCTYMAIFENEIVSMSVFIMRSDYTMPLHDHPMMYGLLRGIFGQLRVQSYTQKFEPNQTLAYDPNQREVTTITEKPRMINTETECAVLTPTESNFHQITAVNGVAAFFDILSPPYDADMPIYGRRHCRFYSPKTEAIPETNTTVELMRIASPLSYYCDVIDTPKSLIKCAFKCTTNTYEHPEGSSVKA